MEARRRCQRLAAMDRTSGFTLVELMITVVLISIVVGIALPSYQNSVRKAHRASAQSFLLEVANREQQLFTTSRRYADTVAKLGLTVPDKVSPYYEITIALDAGPPADFVITATPIGSQVDDGKLSIDRSGQKLPTDKW